MLTDNSDQQPKDSMEWDPPLPDPEVMDLTEEDMLIESSAGSSDGPSAKPPEDDMLIDNSNLQPAS